MFWLSHEGNDDGGEVEFLFQAYEFHHKAAGCGSFLGVVADEGDVVDDEEADALCGGFFDGVEDFLFEVGSGDEFGINLGTDEVGGEDVYQTCGDVAVTHLELFGGEFEVDIHYLFLTGYGLSYLDGKYGFADIAGGEDDGVLKLYDEVVEVHLGIGRVQCFLDPVVGGLEGEKACAQGYCQISAAKEIINFKCRNRLLHGTLHKKRYGKQY